MTPNARSITEFASHKKCGEVVYIVMHNRDLYTIKTSSTQILHRASYIINVYQLYKYSDSSYAVNIYERKLLLFDCKKACNSFLPTLKKVVL